jgi:hypothetical protein
MVIIPLPIIEGDDVTSTSFNPIQITSVFDTYEGTFIYSLFDVVNNDRGAQGHLSYLSYDDVKALLLPTGFFYELNQIGSLRLVLFNNIQTVGIAPYLRFHCQIMQNGLNNTSFVDQSFLTVKTILESM